MGTSGPLEYFIPDTIELGSSYVIVVDSVSRISGPDTGDGDISLEHIKGRPRGDQ